MILLITQSKIVRCVNRFAVYSTRAQADIVYILLIVGTILAYSVFVGF